jgi:hypothetical protein
VSRDRRLGVSIDAALAGVLGAAFAAIVFLATAGFDLGPNTWVEIVLLAVGAGVVVGAVLLAAPRLPPYAAAAVALFAALAVLSYLSIAWSVQPAASWVQANRTLSYLAAFAAAAMLARLAPGRWPAVLGAVGVATVVVCGYALLSKVFPATINANDHLGRLRVPFGYWNATGLMAALGLPVCLWAGTRRATGRVLRSLTVPALALLLTTLVLSYSRGALLTAVIGVGCWLVLVPLRLRATLLLALGGIGAAVGSGWALAHHAITHDGASIAARTAAGHDFGVVLLVVLILSGAAGFLATREMDRITLPDHVRRRIGTVLLILVALVPLAAVAGAAASSRGLTGQVSHVWSTLTSTKSHVGNGPGRLAALSNSRPLYWSDGLKVGEHNLLAGAGAGGFDTARTQYSTSQDAVSHAHSYVFETFADFGLIGIAVSLALLAAWGVAVRQTLGGTRADERQASERAGLITMLAVVATFGVSSLIDWTWFIPGVTVPALVCAGWLAGPGPLRQAAAATAPSSAPAPRRAIAPARAAALVGIVAALLIAGWFVWQPLHSSDQVSSSVDALIRGDAPAALAAANGAAASDPVSVDPLWQLAAIYSAMHDPVASREEWLKATQLQPSNAQTWQLLGLFDLQAHRPQLALAELNTARRLDRTSLQICTLITQAHNQLVSAQRAQTGSA